MGVEASLALASSIAVGAVSMLVVLPATLLFLWVEKSSYHGAPENDRKI